MTTRLFDRIATLLKADAHGVVESLEERSLLLKQYLREAEIALNRKARPARGGARGSQAPARERCGAPPTRRDRSLDEDVTLALSGGKDDLARFAIRRLLARRSEAADLRAQLAEREREEQALAERVAAQQTQFDALRARVRAELAREDEP